MALHLKITTPMVIVVTARTWRRRILAVVELVFGCCIEGHLQEMCDNGVTWPHTITFGGRFPLERISGVSAPHSSSNEKLLLFPLLPLLQI
jgi:hypothetical protein